MVPKARSYVTCFLLWVLLILSPWTVTESFAPKGAFPHFEAPRSLRLYRRSSPSKTLLKLFRSRKERLNGGNNNKYVREIESHIDWMELLQGDEDDFDAEDNTTTTRIVVVTITATWCRHCKKFTRRWNHKLVHAYYNKAKRKDTRKKKKGSGDVTGRDKNKKDENENDLGSVETRVVPVFASVACDGANKHLCRSLNIKQLPTVQFYWNGELINSFPCSASRGIAMARDTLKQYLDMTSIHELEQERLQWAIFEEASRESSPANAVAASRGRRRPNWWRTTDWAPMESLYIRKRGRKMNL